MNRLYLVKFVTVIPVVADCPEDAMAHGQDAVEDEIFIAGNVEMTATAVLKRNQLPEEMAKRKPANGHRSGPYCREIVADTERRIAEDAKSQLKLFE